MDSKPEDPLFFASVNYPKPVYYADEPLEVEKVLSNHFLYFVNLLFTSPG